MRNNQPVTNNEIFLEAGVKLVSKTDLKGIISYVNNAFVEVCGYSREELLGENHNLVRHPDMPAVAFEGLWDTVGAGRPWNGRVKNRCKNGDYYWVDANAIPIIKQGKIVELMSVRTAASAEQVEEAELLYRQLNAGINPGGGVLSRLAGLRTYLSLKNIFAALMLVAALLYTNAWWMNSQSLAEVNTAIGSLQLEGSSAVQQGRAIQRQLQAATDRATWHQVFNFAFLLAGLIWLLVRRVFKPLRSALDIFIKVADGDFNVPIDVSENDEMGKLYQALHNLKIKLGYDLAEAQRSALEGRQIRSALDVCNTNVMIADKSHNITYINKALATMFSEVEADLKSVLPTFNAKSIIGKNMDIFHENPAHQHQVVDGLRTTHMVEMEVAGLTMAISVTPVFDEKKRRIGSVVEWLDRTADVAIETDIQVIIEGAVGGDMTRRIDLEGKEGFFRNLSSGVNDLVTAADDAIRGVNEIAKGADLAIEDTRGIVEQALEGNLAHRLDFSGKSDLARKLGEPVNQLVEVFERLINDTVIVVNAMAKGDLTQTIDANYKGSFKHLKDGVNGTIDQLTTAGTEIKSSAAAVKSGSEEIASGNADLSVRTEEQAASLEETSSAMEEITATIQQNADNAKAANDLSQSARTAAEAGGKVVGDAIVAMQAINDSSSKIADIIGVIDEIAFQTNLLALNASVEAARAGDQGRGFAVVADEVRNLAGRSATAAKEIKVLIVDSGAKVEDGSRLVNESGETLENIVNSVKKVTDIIAEISSASAEQATGIEEVNKAVIKMDGMTQQNAGLVEEAATASRSLGDESLVLDDLIGFFSVDTVAAPDVLRPKAKSVSPALAKIDDKSQSLALVAGKR
ncbi:MAG: PAS domain-containing protein [Proteobacteria bacterium]|nr:PAS domain-containing protein [Pseudomonadota bacterium]